MKDIAGGAIIPIMMIAEQFSQSSIKGIDLHEQSIDEARKIAQQKNPKNLTYEIASAENYSGGCDIISFSDCLHDMGDPVATVSHAKTK